MKGVKGEEGRVEEKEGKGGRGKSPKRGKGEELGGRLRRGARGPVCFRKLISLRVIKFLWVALRSRATLPRFAKEGCRYEWGIFLFIKPLSRVQEQMYIHAHVESKHVQVDKV